ncbi:MAG: hypothetical protein ABI683_06060 [Ginsengibacter sp.]
MNTQPSIEERLWDYIDGRSSQDEIITIERLIENDEEWKATYRKLTGMNEALHLTELEQPSLRFTKNIMEKIAAFSISPKAITYINKKIIWSIGAFFILVITSLLIYAFTRVEWSANGKTSLPFNPGNIHVENLFNSTYLYIFMMVNVVLGLMLLDKYLQRKKVKHESQGQI